MPGGGGGGSKSINNEDKQAPPRPPALPAGADAACLAANLRAPYDVGRVHVSSYAKKAALRERSGLGDKRLDAQLLAEALAANGAVRELFCNDNRVGDAGVRALAPGLLACARALERLSLAGNGKLLGTDASDPDKFLSTLNTVFDIKNLKVCGETL